MARLISLNFLAADPQLLLPTVVSGPGGAVDQIPLADSYPFVFPNLQRTITLTSTDNLNIVTFEIIGTDIYGTEIIERLFGPNNRTITSSYQYNTITNISSSGNYTNLSIGSGSTGTFQWVKLNSLSIPTQGVVSVDTFGTINYSIYQTTDTIDNWATQGSTFTYRYPFYALLANNPLQVSVGSPIINVYVSEFLRIATGDIVTIQNSKAFANMTENQINITAPVTRQPPANLAPTVFSYYSNGVSNSAGFGGGSVVEFFYPNLPIYNHTIAANQNTPSFNLANPMLPVQLVVNSSSAGGALIANILQEGIA